MAAPVMFVFSNANIPFSLRLSVSGISLVIGAATCYGSHKILRNFVETVRYDGKSLEFTTFSFWNKPVQEKVNVSDLTFIESPLYLLQDNSTEKTYFLPECDILNMIEKGILPSSLSPSQSTEDKDSDSDL